MPNLGEWSANVRMHAEGFEKLNEIQSRVELTKAKLEGLARARIAPLGIELGNILNTIRATTPAARGLQEEIQRVMKSGNVSPRQLEKIVAKSGEQAVKATGQIKNVLAQGGKDVHSIYEKMKTDQQNWASSVRASVLGVADDFRLAFPSTKVQMEKKVAKELEIVNKLEDLRNVRSEKANVQRFKLKNQLKVVKNEIQSMGGRDLVQLREKILTTLMALSESAQITPEAILKVAREMQFFGEVADDATGKATKFQRSLNDIATIYGEKLTNEQIIATNALSAYADELNKVLGTQGKVSPELEQLFNVIMSRKPMSIGQAKDLFGMLMAIEDLNIPDAKIRDLISNMKKALEKEIIPTLVEAERRYKATGTGGWTQLDPNVRARLDMLSYAAHGAMLAFGAMQGSIIQTGFSLIFLKFSLPQVVLPVAALTSELLLLAKAFSFVKDVMIGAAEYSRPMISAWNALTKTTKKLKKDIGTAMFEPLYQYLGIPVLQTVNQVVKELASNFISIFKGGAKLDEFRWNMKVIGEGVQEILGFVKALGKEFSVVLAEGLNILVKVIKPIAQITGTILGWIGRTIEAYPVIGKALSIVGIMAVIASQVTLGYFLLKVFIPSLWNVTKAINIASARMVASAGATGVVATGGAAAAGGAAAGAGGAAAATGKRATGGAGRGVGKTVAKSSVYFLLASLVGGLFAGGSDVNEQLMYERAVERGDKAEALRIRNRAEALGHPITPIFGFATGGIVTKPTIGLVGEAGPEAIIPLTDAKAGGATGMENFTQRIKVFVNPVVEKLSEGFKTITLRLRDLWRGWQMISGPLAVVTGWFSRLWGWVARIFGMWKINIKVPEWLTTDWWISKFGEWNVSLPDIFNAEWWATKWEDIKQLDWIPDFLKPNTWGGYISDLAKTVQNWWESVKPDFFRPEWWSLVAGEINVAWLTLKGYFISFSVSFMEVFGPFIQTIVDSWNKIPWVGEKLHWDFKVEDYKAELKQLSEANTKAIAEQIAANNALARSINNLKQAGMNTMGGTYTNPPYPIDYTSPYPQFPGQPFANGGIVTRPTRAIIGERGPEAVIPLSRMPQIVVNVTGNYILDKHGADALADVVSESIMRKLRNYIPVSVR